MSEYDPQELVHFQYHVPSEADPITRVCMKFGQVHFDIDFVDDQREGTRDMQKVLTTFPTVLSHVRNEALVQKEVDAIDDDLKNLLNPEGE